MKNVSESARRTGSWWHRRAAVLAVGVFGLVRGASPQRSQRLMRLRVLLQAVALVLVAGLLWLLS